MTHRLVILGAGYAGLGAATKASRLLRGQDVQITVVSERDVFLERIRLHELAAGQYSADEPLSSILNPAEVDLITATVTTIDVEAQSITLADTVHPLHYDTLVYALGSGAPAPGVPGLREFGYAIGRFDEATELARRLAGLSAASSVTVIGGGLTGIETATEIAETYPQHQVQLVWNRPVGHWLAPKGRAHIDKALDRFGISVHQGRAAGLTDREVTPMDGRVLPSDVTIWAAGFAVPTLAANAALATNDLGQITVDDRLRSVSHPNVYAAGDAAAAETRGGTLSRMSCQTALPMGRYVADEIARSRSGRSKPVRLRYVWQNISLGRRDGLTQFTRTDDTPTRFLLTGRLAARFKETISRSARLMARSSV